LAKSVYNSGTFLEVSFSFTRISLARKSRSNGGVSGCPLSGRSTLRVLRYRLNTRYSRMSSLMTRFSLLRRRSVLERVRDLRSEVRADVPQRSAVLERLSEDIREFVHGRAAGGHRGIESVRRALVNAGGV
jgi:hypothetical protein